MKRHHPYGHTLALDLAGCDPRTFTRHRIEQYLSVLCDRIHMECEDLHFWDYEEPDEKAAAPPHLRGTSAVQFIKTSSIVVHTLDQLRAFYLDLFSCREFDPALVESLTVEYFGGHVEQMTFFSRG